MGYQIELRHFKYFQTLAKELNFRRAAEKLFISQPGLSRQIKQMEEIFDAVLFIRTKRKVALTEAGLYLLKEVNFIFSHQENIKTQLTNIQQGKMSELRIGFLGSAAHHVIPEFVAGLNKQYPGIRTTLEEMSNRAQIERIQTQLLDVGFVRMKTFPEGICTRLVHRDSFSIVVPENYPLASATPVEIENLKDELFIFFSSEDSPYYFDLVMSICEDHGFRPKVFHKSIHALTIFKLIEEGMGIAILPSSLQHGYNLKVKFIELEHVPQRTELYMVWQVDNRNPSLIHAINSKIGADI